MVSEQRLGTQYDLASKRPTGSSGGFGSGPGGDGAAAKAPTPDDCPGGHGLRPFSSPSQSFYCSRCGDAVGAGATLYGCRACDFDLCAPCRARARIERQQSGGPLASRRRKAPRKTPGALEGDGPGPAVAADQEPQALPAGITVFQAVHQLMTARKALGVSGGAPPWGAQKKKSSWVSFPTA